MFYCLSDIVRQLFVGEIYGRFSVSQQADQLLTPVLVKRRQPAIVLFQRLAPLRHGLRRHQIGDRFCRS